LAADGNPRLLLVANFEHVAGEADLAGGAGRMTSGPVRRGGSISPGFVTSWPGLASRSRLFDATVWYCSPARQSVFSG
jgi:hypothetical protein